MATVGEMVEARANALGTGICIPAPGDVAVVPATVPPSMVEDILRSLGIWDAKVLEGKFIPGYDMCYDADEPDAGPAEVILDRSHEDLEGWFEEKVVRAGRFRVIVLKEEE